MNQKNTGKLTFTILSISLLTVMAGAAMGPQYGPGASPPNGSGAWREEIAMRSR